MATLVWNGPEIVNELHKAAMDGLVNAAYLLRHNIQDNISIPAPPHSLPGEMPHKLSGDLYGSWKIKKNVSKLAVRVTTDIPYVLNLEYGIGMEARPFALRTLTESKDEIRDEVVETIRGKTGKNVSATIEVQ